ncbi:hypothetical protein NliqN6_0696 [Naganishia liquefaciens]|uniref:Erg28-like protein n=1 Tax=Naganishia liquefaciens TaxID=104408 RepID=A0A8H3YCH9_9TREE|nr:hypothetical protein NliqN6_0696 [Naganishia liquefaciens]
MPVSAGDLIASILPSAPFNSGALPLWIAFSTVLGVFNTVQCFISPKLSKRVYSRKPQQVTPLTSRLFGTWTLLASAVRLYTAYHITDQGFYDITLFTYALAFTHFFSELLIFRSASLGPGVLSPLIVASVSTYWAYTQRAYYIGLL